ncbi:class I SAM-dependent methyltransferase [Candidatus Peregrinibacteria bacterium]|nr:class I SAM-dependent methyltransferase [Candidatus Peregrinibacteria bacterium]
MGGPNRAPLAGIESATSSGAGRPATNTNRERNWRTYVNPSASTHQSIRQAELYGVVDRLDPQLGDTVVEFGCAHGALTGLLSEAVGRDGQVVALDVNRQLTSALEGKSGPPNVTVRHPRGGRLPVDSSSADGVASIATLHHVPLVAQPGLFREFERVLKPGKPLVVADVANRTRVAEYFDREVDQTSRAGHKFPFLEMRDFAALCRSARMDLQQWQVEQVPWVFDDISQAGNFLRDMHDAVIPPMQCLRGASRILGISATSEATLILGWQLFFAKALKRSDSRTE